MVTEKQDACSVDSSCCCVDAMVSVDERGQMVLPKEIREKLGIKAGDKLAVVTWDQGDELCCISLIKADRLTGMVRDLLSPMMQDITRKG